MIHSTEDLKLQNKHALIDYNTKTHGDKAEILIQLFYTRITTIIAILALVLSEVSSITSSTTVVMIVIAAAFCIIIVLAIDNESKLRELKRIIENSNVKETKDKFDNKMIECFNIVNAINTGNKKEVILEPKVKSLKAYDKK